MRDIDTLLEAASIASERHGISVSTLSNKICGYGTFFSKLAGNVKRGIQLATYFHVKRELTETYGVDWAEAERRASLQQKPSEVSHDL